MFLAIQDPVNSVPSRKTHPNWKLQPLLKHTIIVSKAEIVLGKGLVMDEEKIVCKGRHTYILQITYKKEGDGFQCDAFCSDGYTFRFYFRKHTDTKSFIDKGMYPLNVRCMVLLEQVISYVHYVRMDKLYISVKFKR